MAHIISKSKFQPHVLQYFREIEKTGREIIITDRGIPVLNIMPYSEDHRKALRSLHNSVLEYEEPTEPVGEEG